MEVSSFSPRKMRHNFSSWIQPNYYKRVIIILASTCDIISQIAACTHAMQNVDIWESLSCRNNDSVIRQIRTHARTDMWHKSMINITNFCESRCSKNRSGRPMKRLDWFTRPGIESILIPKNDDSSRVNLVGMRILYYNSSKKNASVIKFTEMEFT